MAKKRKKMQIQPGDEAVVLLGEQWPHIASKLSTASMAGLDWTDCMVVVLPTTGKAAALCQMFSELTGDVPDADWGAFVLRPEAVAELTEQDSELAILVDETPPDRVLVEVFTGSARVFLFADRGGRIQ